MLSDAAFLKAMLISLIFGHDLQNNRIYFSVRRKLSGWQQISFFFVPERLKGSDAKANGDYR